MLGWLGIGGGVVAGLVVADYFSRDFRLKRAAARMPLTAMRNVVDGRRVKVAGIVVALDAPLLSPISARPCVAWSVRLQQSDGEGGWSHVLNQSEAHEFVIVDDERRSARIDVGRAELVYEVDAEVTTEWPAQPSPRMRDFLQRNRLRTEMTFGDVRPYRAHEAVIEHGERVIVVGVARREPDASPSGMAGAPYRDPPMRLLFAATPSAPLWIFDGPARWRGR